MAEWLLPKQQIGSSIPRIRINNEALRAGKATDRSSILLTRKITHEFSRWRTELGKGVKETAVSLWRSTENRGVFREDESARTTSSIPRIRKKEHLTGKVCCIHYRYMKTMINIKADKEVKENAQKLAKDLGLPF